METALTCARLCSKAPGHLSASTHGLMKPEALTFWHVMINLLTPRLGNLFPTSSQLEDDSVSYELLPPSKALQKSCQGPSWSSPRCSVAKKRLDFDPKASVSLPACALRCLSRAWPGSWSCTMSSAGTVQLRCAAVSASPSSWHRRPHPFCASSSRFCSTVGRHEA